MIGCHDYAGLQIQNYQTLIFYEPDSNQLNAVISLIKENGPKHLHNR